MLAVRKKAARDAVRRRECIYERLYVNRFAAERMMITRNRIASERGECKLPRPAGRINPQNGAAEDRRGFWAREKTERASALFYVE